MKTKILFVSEAPIYGGAERYLITLIEGMDRQDFDIEVILSNKAPERLCQALEALDITQIPIPPIAGKLDFSGILRHIACFRGRRPDIVHFNLSNPLHGQYAMLSARLANVPYQIATLHLPPRSTTPTQRGRFFERKTVCRLDKLIAVCNASRQLMVTHFGINPSKTEAIYNGIDLNAFDHEAVTLSSSNIRSEETIILGSVGRLSKQKGYDTLLEAMPMVLKEVPNLRLLIAGEGPEETNLKSQCERLELDKLVNFLGMRTDIPSLIGSFDVFVLPSRYESFPITILEVMAASKPIVSTSVDGIPESVAEESTGLLVPPENPEALSQALIRLLKDNELRKQMGVSARARVEKNFTLKQMVENTQAIYREILQKS